MYHRIRFKHQLWECFHHLPINKSYFLFQLQDLGFKDMGKCWESATNIYIYIQLCIPTRKGYYMGRGRPNGMESIGNNCQDHLPRVHQGCLLYCFRIVLGPWLLVRTCWWLWHTQKVLRCGQCHDDHIGPYQPTLRSHGLQDFLLKLKLRAPHKKPEAALQLAVSLPYNALVGNMGVLWSLGIRVAKGTWWNMMRNNFKQNLWPIRLDACIRIMLGMLPKIVWCIMKKSHKDILWDFHGFCLASAQTMASVESEDSEKKSLRVLWALPKMLSS